MAQAAPDIFTLSRDLRSRAGQLLMGFTNGIAPCESQGTHSAYTQELRHHLSPLFVYIQRIAEGEHKKLPQLVRTQWDALYADMQQLRPFLGPASPISETVRTTLREQLAEVNQDIILAFDPRAARGDGLGR